MSKRNKSMAWGHWEVKSCFFFEADRLWRLEVVSGKSTRVVYSPVSYEVGETISLKV